MRMHAWTRSIVLVLSAFGLAGSGLGCGSAAPRPTEVTEPWTSGDERAVGIDDTGATPAEEQAASDDGAAGTDTAAPAGH